MEKTKKPNVVKLIICIIFKLLQYTLCNFGNSTIQVNTEKV